MDVSTPWDHKPESKTKSKVGVVSVKSKLSDLAKGSHNRSILLRRVAEISVERRQKQQRILIMTNLRNFTNLP